VHRAVLKAREAGKPVVVTQIGGPEEYVEHEVTGLKVYPNTDSVAWGLGTMLMDFDRARRMGANGRETVQRRFTWDRVAEKTLAIYDPLYVPRMRDVVHLNGKPDAVHSGAAPDRKPSGIVAHSRRREANGTDGRHVQAPGTRHQALVPDPSCLMPDYVSPGDLVSMLRHCGTILREVEAILPPSPKAGDRASARSHGRPVAHPTPKLRVSHSPGRRPNG
jgi:hypothetical protein